MAEKYTSITDAVLAGDMLAAAEMRLRKLDEAFVGLPQMRSQLSTALERAAAEVERLKALKPEADESEKQLGKVVPFDADRYRKSG